MTTEAVLTVLWNALWLIILASLTLAVGLGVIAGLIWLYLYCGRKMLEFLHKAYDEAVKPLTVQNGKKVKAT